MKHVLFLSILVIFSGCASVPKIPLVSGIFYGQDGVENDKTNADGNAEVVDVLTADSSSTATSDPMFQSNMQADAFGALRRPPIMAKSSGTYASMPFVNHVGDYVRDMAQNLVANMEYVTERTPVAITNFVLIDSDLKETNLLGKQMTESFIHEFHKFRMPVVEFKATDYITVAETGDFILSRDYLDLTSSTPIQYVLTGTLTKHQGGYIANAKMLGMQSKVVVASAQSFIPYYIVDALIPSSSSRQSEVVDGVRIISSGE
ncbi:MAG: FlgO family outer membrane protein [Pseudomonadota bacterium]